MDIGIEYLNLLPQLAADLKQIKKQLEGEGTKRWLNVRELALYLGYSKDRIYKIKDEYLIEGEHFYNRTGKILFDRVAIDSWVVGKDTYETDHKQRQVVDHILLSVKEI